MDDKPLVLTMTVRIVSSYIGTNTIRAAELPALIAAVHASLAGIGPRKRAEKRTPALEPALPAKAN